MSIRGRLIQLVLTAAIPALLLAAFATYVSYRDQVSTVERHLAETTRAIALGIDREFGQSEALLRGLSSSRHLDDGDLAGFYRQAKAAVPDPKRWIVLNGPDSGRQLVNTVLPWGAELPLPSDAEKDWVTEAAGTGRRVVKNVLYDPAAHAWAVAVQLPIVRDGRVVYVLNEFSNVAVLQHGLEQQRLPENWVVTVLDRSGIAAARSKAPEKFIGAPPSPTLQEALAKKTEGVTVGKTLEGVSVLTGFARAPESGWTVAMGVPESEILAPIYRSALLIFLGASTIIAVAVFFASMLARRIAQPIRAHAAAAATLGAGGEVALGRSNLREIDAVSLSLREAAARIRQRTEERDRTEHALNELNATLEQRVADRTEELAAMNQQLASEIAVRHRAEEALLHAQKLEAVGQLTGGIAHDFNNLLTAVLGTLDLLESRVDASLARFVQTARHAAERGARLTQQLLAFSRKQRLDAAPTDLNAVIAGMTEMLHHTLGGRIGVSTSLASDLWPANAEAQQIELCLLNLAINARDAMRDVGHLHIATSNTRLGDADCGDLPPGDYVAITVADTGSGMEETVRRRAFDPFFTTKPVGSGSGLGLSMVYGTFRQLGGDVRLASTPGVGTTVTLYLPRLGTPMVTNPAIPSPFALAPAFSGNADQILLVDDDREVRPILTEMLRASGYRVTECDSGREALAMLGGPGRFDLVIADYAMPEMTGEELLRRIRLSAPSLPVIMVTGYAELEALKHIGDVKVLRKPVAMATLIAAVEQALPARTGATVVPLRPPGEGGASRA